MKKIILGLLSVLLLGQVSWAQPVSDMAVIPMGITVQSVMRLTITKGGNIEFVFKSAQDIATGVPSDFGTNYETTGTISASCNWDLNLTVDETNFIGEDGTTLGLTYVEYHLLDTSGGAPGATFTDHGDGTLNTPIDDLITVGTGAGAFNYGNNIKFAIQWRCGHPSNATLPGSTTAQRYSANIILHLATHN